MAHCEYWVPTKHTHSTLALYSSSTLFRFSSQYLFDGFFRFTFIVHYIVVSMLMLMLIFIDTRWIECESGTLTVLHVWILFFIRLDWIFFSHLDWLITSLTCIRVNICEIQHWVLQLKIDYNNYFRRSLPRAHLLFR